MAGDERLAPSLLKWWVIVLGMPVVYRQRLPFKITIEKIGSNKSLQNVLGEERLQESAVIIHKTEDWKANIL